MDQVFVKDSAKKVRDVVAAAGKGITVARFARFVVGEAAEADCGVAHRLIDHDRPRRTTRWRARPTSTARPPSAASC